MWGAYIHTYICLIGWSVYKSKKGVKLDRNRVTTYLRLIQFFTMLSLNDEYGFLFSERGNKFTLPFSGERGTSSNLVAAGGNLPLLQGKVGRKIGIVGKRKGFKGEIIGMLV